MMVSSSQRSNWMDVLDGGSAEGASWISGFYKGNPQENRSNARTKMVDIEKQSSCSRIKAVLVRLHFEKFDEGLAGFWK